MWVETPDFSILILFLICRPARARAQRPSAAHGGGRRRRSSDRRASTRGAAGDNTASCTRPTRARRFRAAAPGRYASSIEGAGSVARVNARDGARRTCCAEGKADKYQFEVTIHARTTFCPAPRQPAGAVEPAAPSPPATKPVKSAKRRGAVGRGAVAGVHDVCQPEDVDARPKPAVFVVRRSWTRRSRGSRRGGGGPAGVRPRAPPVIRALPLAQGEAGRGRATSSSPCSARPCGR